jgi:hypothetical protein
MYCLSHEHCKKIGHFSKLNELVFSGTSLCDEDTQMKGKQLPIKTAVVMDG